MEGVQESIDQVWRAVRFWVKLLSGELNSSRHLSKQDLQSLEEFQLERRSICVRCRKLIAWSKLSVVIQEAWEVEELYAMREM